jgi:hypothetical protein
MAIIDDGSGNLELTGEHLKKYIKKRFPNSDYVKKMEHEGIEGDGIIEPFKSDLSYKLGFGPNTEEECEEFMITSRVDELTNEIIELKKTIRLLKQKLEYHKL